MDEQAKRDLRNVIVFAMVDGKLGVEEKRFVESLRVRLGIGEAELRELCDEVRRDPKRLSLPRDRQEAADVVRLLVGAAAADGEISTRERQLLSRLASKAGLEESDIEEVIASAQGAHQEEIEALTAEIYAHFAEWGAATRAEKVAALAAFGRESVLPLLRILESYRVPDGANDLLELKELVVEHLGRLEDDRAPYYLAQQVNIGDIEDEISSAALRYAAAEALGRLVGKEFTRDQEGVVAARAWWFGGGIREYDRLAF